MDKEWQAVLDQGMDELNAAYAIFGDRPGSPFFLVMAMVLARFKQFDEEHERGRQNGHPVD